MSVLKQRLMELRAALEDDAGLAAEVPAGLLLSDVCEALGLEDSERREVLGKKGARFVDDVLGAPVKLAGKNGAR
jgi:hypothetical protein